MNENEYCQISASSPWKMPRPGIKLRSTRRIAQRERVLAGLWMNASRSLRACCAETISTRSLCKPAKTICRSCAPFSNNASAAFVFDEGDRTSGEQWSNEMNSPGTTPRLHYSIIPLLLAEEFHDI